MGLDQRAYFLAFLAAGFFAAGFFAAFLAAFFVAIICHLLWQFRLTDSEIACYVNFPRRTGPATYETADCLSVSRFQGSGFPVHR